ncbi:hypothetical protein KIL84_006763 [Mauremys mutica]|uniref:Uncharacterized protein n=1 Tax=Mauremys mutica TaxID=74926 RepID=A0A9D3X1U6_9SAUR|nr:hypothetical protein KIL84_006763 [Mauremys mutica]
MGVAARELTLKLHRNPPELEWEFPWRNTISPPLISATLPDPQTRDPTPMHMAGQRETLPPPLQAGLASQPVSSSPTFPALQVDKPVTDPSPGALGSLEMGNRDQFSPCL